MTGTRPTGALAAVAVALAALLLSGCGSSSGSSVTAPTVAPAQTTHLDGFEPSGLITAGKPTTMSFDIKLSRTARRITRYKTGSGPHTGVHLIIVRNDLAYIHPPAPADPAQRRPSSDRHLPRALSPSTSSWTSLPRRCRGCCPTSSCTATSGWPAPITPSSCHRSRAHQVVDGIHFEVCRATLPCTPSRRSSSTSTSPIHARQAGPLHPVVRGAGACHLLPEGHPQLLPRTCTRPTLPTAAASPGPPGSPAAPPAPGKLTLGVLLPISGTWRLFVQLKIDGRIVTAPFTLDVA